MGWRRVDARQGYRRGAHRHRPKAGLMDVSGLKKVHLVGPHVAHVIDAGEDPRCAAHQPGRSAYDCMRNDGKFIENCILYRTGPDRTHRLTGRPRVRQRPRGPAAGRGRQETSRSCSTTISMTCRPGQLASTSCSDTCRASATCRTSTTPRRDCWTRPRCCREPPNRRARYEIFCRPRTP